MSVRNFQVKEKTHKIKQKLKIFCNRNLLDVRKFRNGNK